MIHLDYLLVIGILLSILLFLLVGAFYCKCQYKNVQF